MKSTPMVPHPRADSRVPPRTARLEAVPNAARAAFLAEALRFALAEEVPALVEAGLAAGGDAARMALQRAGRAGGAELVAQAPGRLGDAVEAWIGTWEPQAAPIPVLGGLARRKDASVVRGLAMHAGGPHAHLLAPTLLESVRSTLGPHGRRPSDAACRSELVAAALRLGGDQGAMRQPSAALALLLLGVPPTDADDDWLGQALRRAVARVHEPVVATNLVRWLAHERVGLAAARHMHRALEASPSAVLRDAHLVRTPTRRRRLRRIDRPMRVAQSIVDALERVDDPVPASSVNLLAALDISTARRGRMLDALAGHGRADVRVAARRCRIAEGRLPPLDDEADAVGPRAALLIDAWRPLATTRIAALSRRRDPQVRRRASWRVAERDVAAAAVLASMGAMPIAWRSALVRAWLGRDRDAIVAALDDRLAGAPEAGRVALIEVVRRAALVRSVEATLVACAREPSSILASAAIRALGSGASLAGLELIRAGLAADDPRVQANAVEAAGEFEAIAPEALAEELLRSRRNRTRANAVRIATERRPATGLLELARMLGDEDPLHRISAIWVARTIGAIETVEPLRMLARAESLAPVRVRAEAAMRWIAARTATPRGPRHAQRRRREPTT